MRFPIAISVLSVLVYSIKEEPTKLQIGIKKRIPEKECTRKAAHGDNVKVHYVGTLFSTGEEFDSSRSRDVPFDFKLGAGMVIKGWDQGVVGMCVGELRKLVIPYTLAYGESGSPPKIPAKATLVFEVELVELPPLDESKEDDEKFDTVVDEEQVEL